MITAQALEKIHNPPQFTRFPELRFRPFRGKQDYAGMARLIQRSYTADEIQGIATVEDVTNSYEHLVNCDPKRDMLMAEVAGELAGYTRITWRKAEDGSRIYLLIIYLAPEWRDEEIGGAMLQFAESRSHQIASEHPPEDQKFLMVEVNAREKAKIALLEKRFYHPIRYFMSMVRDLGQPIPEARLPDGLETRPAKPEHYRLIWEAKGEAFQDHWGHIPPSEEDYQSWLSNRLFQPDLWQIAWDGDQVVGTTLGYIDAEENFAYQRKRGYTEDICVRKPWRRSGVARSLLVQCMIAVKECGMTEAALGVDTENPNEAARLYTSVGFQPSERFMAYRKPLETDR